MSLEFFPISLRAVLKVSVFIIFAELLDTHLTLVVSDYHGIINSKRVDNPWEIVKYVHYYTNNLIPTPAIGTTPGPCCMGRNHVTLPPPRPYQAPHTSSN